MYSENFFLAESSLVENIKLPVNDISYYSMVINELFNKIENFRDLVKSIKVYNTDLENSNFDNLYILKDVLSFEEHNYIFNCLLTFMLDLVIKQTYLFDNGIPIFKKGETSSFNFTQEQVACLLANAFFCTFKNRGFNRSLPEINFNNLFSRSSERNNCKIEKLKCLLNYFKRVISDESKGIITFQRRSLSLSDIPVWAHSNNKISKIEILKNTTIEKQDGWKVDFANKDIGGGILGTGCVQEEILFSMNPELILARLFNETMMDNEALLIIGTEQFNSYTGYSESFKWEENYYDFKDFDLLGRRKNYVIAIDASNYSNSPKDQFEKKSLDRELNKAYCGFLKEHYFNRENLNSYTESELDSMFETDFLPIVTGNWGCGVFGGNVYLKFLIQVLAASEANRDIVFVCLKDDKFYHDLLKFKDFLTSNCFTVGRIYTFLQKNLSSFKHVKDKTFFEYIYGMKNLI